LAGQPMAEHRMYLPLAIIIWLGVVGLYTWIGRRSLIVFAAAAVGLGWMTIERNKVYRSGLVIWSDTVAKCPENARAHYNLGNALVKMPGRLPEAISAYEVALRFNPNYAEAHNNLGEALTEIPSRLPDALVRFETAVRINPAYAEAHSNLANVLAGIPGRLPDAISEYETALQIKPDLYGANNDLGIILANIPGRLPEAIKHFEAALQIEPDSPGAQTNLKVARQMLEKLQEAQR
jgi:tetratricopeptide (TPR) repeat protein